MLAIDWNTAPQMKSAVSQKPLWLLLPLCIVRCSFSSSSSSYYYYSRIHLLIHRSRYIYIYKCGVCIRCVILERLRYEDAMTLKCNTFRHTYSSEPSWNALTYTQQHTTQTRRNICQTFYSHKHTQTGWLL